MAHDWFHILNHHWFQVFDIENIYEITIGFMLPIILITRWLCKQMENVKEKNDKRIESNMADGSWFA